jgi:hypothetical protein
MLSMLTADSRATPSSSGVTITIDCDLRSDVVSGATTTDDSRS